VFCCTFKQIPTDFTLFKSLTFLRRLLFCCLCVSGDSTGLLGLPDSIISSTVYLVIRTFAQVA
jgi:hypothetical protein